MLHKYIAPVLFAKNDYRVKKKSVEVSECDLDQSGLQLGPITSQLGVFDSDPLFHFR